MAPERRYLLDPVDLTNKWGFADGNLFDEYVADLAAKLDPSSAPQSNPLWPFLSEQLLFSSVIREKLLPHIPSHIADHVQEIRSIHNPMRLPHPDDDPRAYAWEEELSALEPIVLTEADIDEIAERHFGGRDLAFIRLYNAMVAYDPATPGVRDQVIDLIDSIGATPEEMRLAAELIDGPLTEARDSGQLSDFRIAFDADSDHVAVLGRHLDSVMVAVRRVLS